MRSWSSSSSSSSSLTITLVLFFFIALLSSLSHEVGGAVLGYTQRSCNPTGTADTYAPNSTYSSNLNRLLLSFVSYANSTTTALFHSATSPHSHPTSAATVYGLYLCRGDDDPSSCSACISSAATDIPDMCPNSTEAIIWKELCMLRYSNRPTIFSTLDTSFSYDDGQMMYNVNNVTDFDSWMKVQWRTLDSVTYKAAVAGDENKKKFATEEADYQHIYTLYSLAECTPDLTSLDCRQCFEAAKEHLPPHSQGGIVMLPSCNLRFEIYPFYDVLLAPAPTPKASVSLEGRRGGKTNHLDTLQHAGEKKHRGRVLIIVVLSTVLPSTCIIFLWWRAKKRKNLLNVQNNSNVKDDDGAFDFRTIESLQFDFSTLQIATSNFLPHSKIGSGGFGEVYKAILENGQVVAIKRLYKRCEQGIEEFKNEVAVVVKLQHKNLVRLLGFCLHEDEKLLVFEFVPNHSLDYFLFDPTKQTLLSWSTRFKIIEGIARGLLYLHEDSRLRIIHRDIKANNILLDEKMAPKIADFGMARMFEADQTEDKTGRIAGTHGYMAPEYVVQGQYSMKSDVYSFGVLVLEIVSGKKNRSFHQTGLAHDLINYGMELWLQDRPLHLMDMTIRDSQYLTNEVKRCIQIGLLCVQKDVDKRPSMKGVVHMLNTSSFKNFPSPEKTECLTLGLIQANQLDHTMPHEQRVSDQSASVSVPPFSVNKVSVTEMSAR